MSETDEDEQAMTVRLPKGTHRTLRILSATTGVAMNTHDQRGRRGMARQAGSRPVGQPEG